MPSYMYEVIDKDGNKKTDVLDAASEEVLVNKLQGEGYFVISVRLSKEKDVLPKAVKKEEASLRFAHEKCKIEDLLAFSRQLATLLEAGITMLRSLDVVLPQIQSRQLYLAVKVVHDQIEQGSSFSAALAKYPKIFNQFWVSLAQVGEASGTMPMILNRLAEHVEKDQAFRSAVVSAMIYPAILCFVCVGAVIFFALVVGPKFEAVFASMHTQLPLMTRCLLSTFDFIKHYILLFLGLAVAAFIAAKSYVSTYAGRRQLEQLIYKLPVFGEITRLIIVERFAAQMSILTESGVPILYSLEITEKVVDNITCGLVVAQVRGAVREGKGMADALTAAGFFPVMAVQMIRVGEETGELGKMLKHVAQYYQTNVENFMKRFGTIIEPFLLVFMAGVIGTIVISIFLPLFKLGQGAHFH
ncbi:MAG: type II secretion system F family protein [Candidatus Omnitrophica bacterium]|nr:type II secretion system F family protein [Candidatus Omnitrophota bacterium]MDE2009415.1 type II secretion system F family protein [Candidatus Omnitrophota bacterium]MDE2214199.1 type II secretion system F family protein [Candidatus Omnitrophota bacterium]MDE2231236.1 type II secretion system F family protein [Candidatus Omnitrophota bacterium]